MSRAHLAEHPLCVYCAQQGQEVPATVVDHIVPIKVAPDLAWEPMNWQSLCKPHHNSRKRAIERRGYHDELDARGYPIDPLHPANRARGRL